MGPLGRLLEMLDMDDDDRRRRRDGDDPDRHDDWDADRSRWDDGDRRPRRGRDGLMSEFFD